MKPEVSGHRDSCRGGLSFVVALLVLLPAVLLGQPPSGGDGTLFIATYKGTIDVVDEATFSKQAEIELPFGVPGWSTLLSQDRTHLYVMSADMEKVAVIDVAAREIVDSFDLQEGRKHVKIWEAALAPDESWALLLTKSVTRQIDRFEIGEPTLLRYDLENKEVLGEVPWPDGKQQEFAQILFSPDGESVYFLGDEIIVYDAETFEEIDRWKYGRAWGEGLGDFRFGFPQSLYEEPGFYTGMFRVTDPVQNRPLMGVARVDLVNRDVDFFVLGPAERVGFTLSPDRRKAYGLKQAVGDYQLWTFDLENRRVAGKVQFEGRPRMSLRTSSNGELLYIHGAGPTFDVYDAETFEPLGTHTLDADMIGVVLLPPAR